MVFDFDEDIYRQWTNEWTDGHHVLPSFECETFQQMKNAKVPKVQSRIIEKNAKQNK